MKPDELRQLGAKVAALPAGELDGDDALRSVIEVSVALVPGCAAASLSLAGPDAVTTRASTGRLAEVADEIQYRLGEGPCLEAITTGSVARLNAVAAPGRWPKFWSEVQPHGLQRTLSVPLRIGERTAGSLNLYGQSAELDADEDAELLSVLLASYLAMTLAAGDAAEANRSMVDQLNQALTSRDLIGQAKGILMAREGCSADQAFDMLRRASQRLNQKLRDVADQIVESATSPRGSSSHRA